MNTAVLFNQHQHDYFIQFSQQGVKKSLGLCDGTTRGLRDYKKASSNYTFLLNVLI